MADTDIFPSPSTTSVSGLRVATSTPGTVPSASYPAEAVFADHAGGNAAAPNCVAPLAAVSGLPGAPSVVDAAATAASANAMPAPTQLPDATVNGKRVLLRGLVRTPEFNGEWGTVESYDPASERYLVQILRDGGLPPVLAKLRRENLVVPQTVALRFDDDQAGASATASGARDGAVPGGAAGAGSLCPPPSEAIPPGSGSGDAVAAFISSGAWRPTLRKVDGDSI